MSQEKTLFEKIADKEIPAEIVYEDENIVAIVDKFPIKKGQIVIFPRTAPDYIFNLDDETYQKLMSVAKKIGPAIDKAFNPTRTCLVIEGFEVPHVHVKLIPAYEGYLQTSGGEEIFEEVAFKTYEGILDFLSL